MSNKQDSSQMSEFIKDHKVMDCRKGEREKVRENVRERTN